MSQFRTLRRRKSTKLPGVLTLTAQISRQDWVARCAREIEVLVPLRAEDRYEVLSADFVNEWAAAIWTSSQGAEQPELAAWAAVREAEIVWGKVPDELLSTTS